VLLKYVVFVKEIFAQDHIVAAVFKNFEGHWNSLAGLESLVRLDLSSRLLIAAIGKL
jgi:hypothetical protein